jgi:flagellar hook-length control protein FliK
MISPASKPLLDLLTSPSTSTKSLLTQPSARSAVQDARFDGLFRSTLERKPGRSKADRAGAGAADKLTKPADDRRAAGSSPAAPGGKTKSAERSDKPGTAEVGAASADVSERVSTAEGSKVSADDSDPTAAAEAGADGAASGDQVDGTGAAQLPVAVQDPASDPAASASMEPGSDQAMAAGTGNGGAGSQQGNGEASPAAPNTAQHHAEAKAAPAITVARFNEQLLTADPRRMLLGLEAPGSRMLSGEPRSQSLATRLGERVRSASTGERNDASERSVAAGHAGVLQSHSSGVSESAGVASAAGSTGRLANSGIPDAAAASSGPEQQAEKKHDGGTSSGNATPPPVNTQPGQPNPVSSAAVAGPAAASTLPDRPAGNSTTPSTSPVAGSGPAGRAEAAKAETRQPDEAPRPDRAFAAQVERALALASRQAERPGAGNSPVTLRLRPENLGQLRIRLTVADDAVGVRIEVGTTEARRLLSDSMDSLRQSMQDKGLSLSKSSVLLDPSLAAEASKAQDWQPREAADSSRTPVPAWNGYQAGQQSLGAQQDRPGTSPDREQSRGRSGNRGGFFDAALLMTEPSGQRTAAGR